MGSERRWNKRAPRGHRKSLAIRPREPSGLRSSDPRPSAPTEHPFVLDANRYTWLREQTKSGRGMLQRSTFFSLFFFLSFRPCISRDSKIPLEFLPFPRLIGQFIWLSWSGVNWLIELMNFNQKCEREIDLGSYLFEIKILIETNPRRNFQNSVFQNLNAEYTWYIKVIYPFIALLYSVFYIAWIDKMKNSRCKFGSF